MPCVSTPGPCGKPSLTSIGYTDVSAASLCLPHYSKQFSVEAIYARLPKTPILDRADGPNGPAPKWLDMYGEPISIDSGHFTGSTDWPAGLWPTVFAANQEVYLQVGMRAVWHWFYLRAADTHNFYVVDFSNEDPPAINFKKTVADTETLLQTIAGPRLVPGDMIGAAAIGSKLYAWRNGVVLDTCTDATYAGGGKIGQGFGVPGWSDNFGGGGLA